MVALVLVLAQAPVLVLVLAQAPVLVLVLVKVFELKVEVRPRVHHNQGRALGPQTDRTYHPATCPLALSLKVAYICL